MHYPKLLVFSSIDYRNLYGYFIPFSWGTAKGKIKGFGKTLWIQAIIALGILCQCSINPAYALNWGIQDSYKFDNQLGGGLDCFLTGNNSHNLLYVGMQTYATNAYSQIGIGTGSRHLIGHKHSVGGYVFWDGVVDYFDKGFAFSNINAGIEANFHFLTFRFNGYAPFTRIKREQTNWTNKNQGNYLLSKGNCYVDEMVQWGWDGKAGITAFKDKVQLFGGVYWFEGDMVQPMQGAVGGMSIDVTPRIRVQCQYTYDILRQPFFSLGLQFNRAASQSLHSMGPLYRLWRPSERSVLPAGFYKRGTWRVVAKDLYFVKKPGSKKKAERLQQSELATFEHPAWSLDQNLLDAIAKQSRQATIFIYPGIYDNMECLKLGPRQSLKGIKKESENILQQPQLYVKTLRCGGEQVIQDMLISQVSTEQPCSIVEIFNVKNVSFIRNTINSNSKQFMTKGITGIDIDNASCILDSNVIRLENTACFSEAILTGIRAKGDQSVSMPTKNWINLCTHSREDLLKPINVEGLPQKIKYPAEGSANIIQIALPLYEDYLDRPLISLQDNLHKKEKVNLQKISVPEEESYETINQDRSVIVHRRLSFLWDNYNRKNKIPPEVKESDIQELKHIWEIIKGNIEDIEKELNANTNVESLEKAYNVLYNVFLSHGMLGEMTLEQFKKNSLDNILRLDLKKAKQNIEKEYLNSACLVKSFLKAKEILQDMQAIQRMLQHYSKRIEPIH